MRKGRKTKAGAKKNPDKNTNSTTQENKKVPPSEAEKKATDGKGDDAVKSKRGEIVLETVGEIVDKEEQRIKPSRTKAGSPKDQADNDESADDRQNKGNSSKENRSNKRTSKRKSVSLQKAEDSVSDEDEPAKKSRKSNESKEELKEKQGKYKHQTSSAAGKRSTNVTTTNNNNNSGDSNQEVQVGDKPEPETSKNVKSTSKKKNKNEKKQTKQKRKAVVENDDNDKKGSDDEESDAGSEEYEVEKLVDVYFKKNGKREFLVRWKGYSSKEDTWEPESHLNCQELIDSYLEKCEKAKRTQPREMRVNPKVTDRYVVNSTTGRKCSARLNQGPRKTYYEAD